MRAELFRPLLGEAIGTGILVLFGAGSLVAALTVGDGELDYAGLGMVAITFALAIALAIYAFGSTSGAHLNPAVTVSLAAVRRFPWSDVPTYVGAQLIGAMAGAALIRPSSAATQSISAAARRASRMARPTSRPFSQRRSAPSCW